MAGRSGDRGGAEGPGHGGGGHVGATRASPILSLMPRRQNQRDLSAAAQEYLLALRVMAGSPDAGRVTAAQVARHLGVTTQASSEMSADSLRTDSSITPRAATYASARPAVPRLMPSSGGHALLESPLTSVVGLGWQNRTTRRWTPGRDSPRVEARLDEMLGHPETCPHGNPIDAETARRRPREPV